MMNQYESEYEYEFEEEVVEEEEEDVIDEKEQWIVLDNHPGYCVSSIYPHRVKDIATDEFAKERMDSKGYIRVKLDGRTYPKHRVIAEQFIPNPDNLPDVDHINRNRADNRLENLRWVSRADNNRNRSACNGFKYEYIDELPDGAEPFTEYKGRKLEKLYRKDKDFYFDVGPHFRKVPVCIGNKRKVKPHINFTDVTGLHIKIFIHLL